MLKPFQTVQCLLKRRSRGKQNTNKNEAFKAVESRTGFYQFSGKWYEQVIYTTPTYCCCCFSPAPNRGQAG